MKRKLALLLASVMAISALPMTAYADSTNGLTRTSIIASKNTVLLEEGWISTAGEIDDVSGFEYFQEGTTLKIVAKNDMDAGKKFQLKLTGAEFFFRNAVAGTTTTETVKVKNDFTSDFGTILNATGYNAGTTTNAGTDNLVANNFVAAVVTPGSPTTPATVDYVITSTATSTSKYEAAQATATGKNTTYSTANGIYLPNSRAYVRFGDYNNDKYEDVPYVMQLDSSDSKGATVTVVDKVKEGDVILIPLVTRLTGDDTYKVEILSGSAISPTGHQIVAGSEGKTSTKALDTVTARTNFSLENIVITESRIGSIKPQSGFKLTAPSGYEFASINTAGSGTLVSVHTQGGIAWDRAGVPVTGEGIVGSGNDYEIAWAGNSSNERRAIKINKLDVKTSSSLRGELVIKGLVLQAEDSDRVPDGDELSLRIEDIDGKDSFTEQTFLVAKVKDYGIKLALKDSKTTIPEVISGRMETYSEFASTTNHNITNMTEVIEDKNHKAAKVKFSEETVSSWWADHKTTFSLPEGVTIIKAEFSEIKEIDNESDLKTKGASNKAVYYNTRKKDTKVKVNDNTLELSDLKVKSGKKASFELQLWLGVAVDFEGDIDLSVNASAKTTGDKEVEKVTIAKAISPIKVEATVSEVQVGYQYFSVGDFSITENVKGALLDGEKVYVSVTDGISVDMNIANGFKWEITEGNIKIDKVNRKNILGVSQNGTGADEQITFEIDQESTKASTIKFSNVQVKVDRNVAYSSLSHSGDKGIDIVVWGPAVAKNYYHVAQTAVSSSGTGKVVNLNDTFDVPGISAKYINVTTIADPTQAQYKNVVKVTIGNPVIKINDVDFSMPVAAYISTASNSTMVPVRFIANALGLDENAVKWDDKARTVTVDATNRIIQFQIGNTNYLVNGVSVPMLSPDGLPVAAEINNERAFVPMRAIGEAFGITVGWDDATSTATYNAPVQK